MTTIPPIPTYPAASLHQLSIPVSHQDKPQSASITAAPVTDSDGDHDSSGAALNVKA